MTALRRRAATILLSASGFSFISSMAIAQSATWIGPSGGSFEVPSNWSGGVAPDGTYDVRIDASPAEKLVIASEGATFRTLTIDAGDMLHVLSTGFVDVAGSSIQNSGTIRIDTESSSRYVIGTQDLTISGGGTILLDGGETTFYLFDDSHFTNLDNTIRGSLSVSKAFTNHGTVIAGSGNYITLGTLDGPIRNSGRIAAEQGGTVSIHMQVDNTGGVVEAEEGGLVRIGSSNFSGGTLRTRESGVIRFADVLTRRMTLVDLTLDGVLRFGTAPGNPSSPKLGETLRLQGEIHNVGTIDVVPVGSGATIEFGQNGQAVHLTGGGQINLGNEGSIMLINRGFYSDNTIRGAGSFSGNMTNDGTIIAAGGILRLGVSLTSTGKLVAETGGRLLFSGNAVHTSTGGAIQVHHGGTLSLVPISTANPQLALNAGSIELDGTLDMQHGTLSATHIAGTGVIHQSAGQINATHLRISSASISGGTTKINSGGGSLGTSRLNALDLSGEGRFDLTDHDLILDYPADAAIDPAQIRSLLASAYADGSWSGPGLTSSAAAASAPSRRTALGYVDNTDGAFTEFSGQPVDDSSMLVKYTLAGDATFDGLVNLKDLLALANSWQSPGFWADGDFDYNGVVDQADLGLLAGNWNGDIEDALQAVGLEGVSIPEPGFGCWILAPLVLSRRRFPRENPPVG